MKKIFLLAFILSFIFVYNLFGQTTVQVNGPSSAQINSQILFTVSFYNNGYQVAPPTGGTSYWDYTGALLVNASDSELRLNYTTTGQQMVYYEYSTYNDYYYDYHYVDVTGYTCENLIPSAVAGSREGPGTVTLSANTAPSGFSYVWYGADQTTLVSTLQNFTTPSLSSTTTYYLGYKRNTTGCVTALVPVKAQIIIYNSVKKYSARTPNTNNNSVISGSTNVSYKTFNYFDALGRPNQTIKKQGTFSGMDLITPGEYDQFGRQVQDYLPYFELSGTQDGRFRSNGISMHSSRTSSIYGDTYGYSQKLFESSPLNRVIKQAAPGNAWRMGSNKEWKFGRRPNTSGEGIRIFYVNSSGLPFTTAAYGSNLLWVEISQDEDDKTTIEYTDKLGRIILKKVQNTATPTGNGHSGWLCTYYVYDDLGQLRVVIPPQATQIMFSKGWNLSTNTTLANAQYFRYTYDGRGRLIEKFVPEKAVEYYLYDAQDRQVGFQDGNLRIDEKWLYTKYDALGRVVITGLTRIPSTTSFASLQTTVNNVGANNATVKENTAKIKTGASITSDKYDGYQQYVASSSITLQPGFTMKATGNQSFTARIGTLPASGSADAWPTEEGEILTVNYYDTYQYLTGYSYANPGTPFLSTASTRVHGLLTGKKVKNLETGEFYTNAMYYDDKGRVIQTIGQHQVGGTVRASTAYNFEDQPTHSLMNNSLSTNYTVLRTYNYNAIGQLASITHKVDNGTDKTIAQYTYDELGRQTVKTFPTIASNANQTNSYNIRGWLTGQGSGYTGIFKQTLYYNTGATYNRFNGNIARVSWTGGQESTPITRTYNYLYDNASRITAATFTSTTSGENSRYNLSGITYDANGNIKTMTRKGERAVGSYNTIDALTYSYATDITSFGDIYSNRLLGVVDGETSNTYTSKDFKPNLGVTGNYLYDDNGNQLVNKDKWISETKFNYLNLPEEISFSTGGKLKFAYDAEGNKLTQKVYNSTGALTKTQDYIGEVVLLNGALDYLIHEEGRIVAENSELWSEYYVKDHLGNIRQVLRSPVSQVFIATMENGRAAVEEESFSMVSESRQTEPAHNVTEGGNQVAWLNTSRGRTVGPGRTQEIYAGDSLKLQVHGKYIEDKKQKANAVSFMTAGAKERLVTDLNDLALSTQRAGGANPIALINLADILAKDLQKKEAPEAYLMYALYDQDSNRYEVGKKVLSRNAANQHEVLEEEMYISKDGYIETFVVNETSEDVWFDNMMVMSVSSVIVQETHYDPWGLELTGLGYQYGGIKVNKYLYNGKELIEDKGLQYYDYGARMYDATLGRWSNRDPMAEIYNSYSPYNYTLNSPIRLKDPNGMWAEDIFPFSIGLFQGISGLLNQQKQDDKKGKTYDGGTLDEVTITASRINDDGNSGNDYSLGDYGTGLSLLGDGMKFLGDNSSTSLYQQGFRRGLNGNYQLTGRNLSLFGNQPMTSATKPLTRLSTIGNGLSNLGTAVGVAGTLVEGYQYSQGRVSGARFSYHTVGTGTSLGATYLLGGPYGALVGAIFFSGEKVWDMGKPMRNEISSQYWQFMNDFDNALRSGWRPR